MPVSPGISYLVNWLIEYHFSILFDHIILDIITKRPIYYSRMKGPYEVKTARHYFDSFKNRSLFLFSNFYSLILVFFFLSFVDLVRNYSLLLRKRKIEFFSFQCVSHFTTEVIFCPRDIQ